jgi:hypothetical protein
MSIYLSSTKHSLARLGRMLADIESTGGADDKASALLRRCTGRVLDVHEERPGVGVVQLGLPLENLNGDNASSAFASMYLYMIGGASMAWMWLRFPSAGTSRPTAGSCGPAPSPWSPPEDPRPVRSPKRWSWPTT